MFTKSIFKTFAITVFLITNMISSIHGAVVDVATPVTKTTIQNAVDAAAAGDVVFIPSGDWSIDGTVNLKEGIHIQGAGRDLTTLNKADQASLSIFKITIASGIPFKISGINFKGIGLDLYLNDPNSTFLDKGVEIYGKAKNFHIYDCRFQRFTDSGIYLYGTSGATLNGHAVGVISGNEFKDIYWSSPASSRGYGVGVYGDDSWPTLQLGDWNAVFIENNYFENNRHCVASNIGSRYVFRYNTINYSYAWTAAVDAHGKTSSFNGSRSYEIYNNSITGSIWEQWNIPNTWAIGVRGGDGVIFNNEIMDSKGMFVSIENWNSNMTYPVACQVRDLWVWGNTLDGAAYNNMNAGVTAQQEIDFVPYLQESRDFYEGSAKSGYAAYVYPHPVSNLCGHWQLDNANSIQVDASAGGNNGTKIGNPSSVAGKCGNALDFIGTSDYIQIPYTPNLNTAEFTISAWTKIEGGAGTYRCLLSSRSSAGCKGYNIYAGSNNKWQFWTGNGTNFQSLHGADIVNNEWTHIVATHTGTINKLYVNGVEYSAGVSAFAVNTTQPFKIGVIDSAAYYFNGLIDDVRYYSRALSQAEIKAMYNRMADPSIENGLASSSTANLDRNWYISSSANAPTIEINDPYDGSKAVCFTKAASSTPQSAIASRYYIPVDGGKSYIISAWAKGSNIVKGTSLHHKLYIIGRWYDKNMSEITGYFPDLSSITAGTTQIPATFPWTKFDSAPLTSPLNAAYYRVTAAGMLNSSSGVGYLDLISFRPVAE